MLPTSFKITLRHLWRQRLFTALNVAGLAVGISACWIIWRITSYEFGFDQGNPNKERLYRVVSRFVMDGKEHGNPGAPKPLPEAIAAEVPGVERVAPMVETFESNLQVPALDGGAPTRFEKIEHLIATNARYFEMVPHRFLAGDPSTALAEPNRIVLTQSRAEQYFPGLRPDQVMGKVLLYRDTLPMQVSGVVADLDYSTTLEAKEFWPISALKWPRNHPYIWVGVNSNNMVLVQLRTGTDPEQVQQQINAICQRNSTNLPNPWGAQRWLLLQPMADWHFNPDYEGNARLAHKPTLLALQAVALFLLLLACINFINLATAQAPQRAREIGVRKTLGSTRGQLLSQFLGETLITTLGATLLATGLVKLFFHHFNAFIPDDIPVVGDWATTLLFLAGLSGAVCLLAGLYPGWVVARFRTANILRGQAEWIGSGGQRLGLRKGLIVFQFVVAQVFILGAFIMHQQLQYGLDKDLGYRKDAIVLFEVPMKLLREDSDHDRRFVLREKLAGLSGVAAAGLGDPPASRSYSTNDHEFKGPKGPVEFNVYHKFVDTAMMRTYGLQLVAGRTLTPSDTAREYVVNETCVRQMGLSSPQEAIGQVLQEKEGNAHPIVGVVRDFHLLSLREPINPVALMCGKENTTTFNVRLASTRPRDWPAALQQVEAAWKAVYPEHPFDYQFFDESLLEFYGAERRTSKIIDLATVVAILVSCFGLFGLVTLTAWQRTKEIGIRKVLGATVANITGLLAKDFLTLVLAAIVLGSPLAWWGMHRWLERFAYRIDISWWMFAVTGALALGVAFLTLSVQSVKAALADPVKSLRSE